jgi:hypothetical protein
MTEATALDLTKYDGKKVVVQRTNSDNVLEEVEGTVQTGNALGLLIKPKGKASVEIIEASSIEGVELAPEKAKKLGPKYIKEVELGQARQHLLDRHGATLNEVNEMTEQEAYDEHFEINHENEDIGHRHGEKPKRNQADVTDSDEDDSDEEPDF